MRRDYKKGNSSKAGYLRNSLSKYNRQNIIDGNNITMDGVDYPLEVTPIYQGGVEGKREIMYPNQNKVFEGAVKVKEEKFQIGGIFADINKYRKKDEVSINPYYEEQQLLKKEEEKKKKEYVSKEGSGLVDNTKANYAKAFLKYTEMERDQAYGVKYKNYQDEARRYHQQAEGACLRGSFNCLAQGTGKMLGREDIRSMIYKLPEEVINSYKVRDNKNAKGYVPNQSIDAWEIHELMRGEGIGKALFDDIDLEYDEGSNIPNNIDYRKIPIGTIIGQGNSAGRYTNKEDGDRSRHAMIVVGFDDSKDKMPIVYDSGIYRRLDEQSKGVLSGASHKVNKFTVPNGYEDLSSTDMFYAYRNYSKSLKNTDGEGLKFKDSKEYNEDTSKNIKVIEEAVNNQLTRIATYYGITEDVVKELATYLPAIAQQETKINGSNGRTKATYVDNFLGNTAQAKGVVKIMKNLETFKHNLYKTGKAQQDYKLEIENFLENGTKEDLNKKLSINKTRKQGYDKDPWNPSVGAFAIKTESEYAKQNGITKDKMYGMDISPKDEMKNGTIGALSLLTESYRTLAKKYPNLKPEELIELTLVSYNNSTKANDPDFHKYYIQDKTLKDDYLEKLKGFREKSYQKGGKFEEFVLSLPENLKSQEEYDLKYLWENNGEPLSFEEAINRDQPLFEEVEEEDGTKSYHGSSVEPNTLRFLKSKNHPTIQKELDWYNGPEGKEFKNKYDLDTSGEYYKYTEKDMKKYFKKGGKFQLGGYGYQSKIFKNPYEYNSILNKTNPQQNEPHTEPTQQSDVTEPVEQIPAEQEPSLVFGRDSVRDITAPYLQPLEDRGYDYTKDNFKDVFPEFDYTQPINQAEEQQPTNTGNTAPATETTQPRETQTAISTPDMAGITQTYNPKKWDTKGIESKPINHIKWNEEAYKEEFTNKNNYKDLDTNQMETYQIPNQYGDVDMETAGQVLGQGIASGNAVDIIGGGGKMLLNSFRNVASGYAQKKRNLRERGDFNKKQRDGRMVNSTNSISMQKGGTIENDLSKYFKKR